MWIGIQSKAQPPLCRLSTPQIAKGNIFRALFYNIRCTQILDRYNNCLASEDGRVDAWVEGTSGSNGNWVSRLANQLKYGHPHGYFVGRTHWREVVEEGARELLHREMSPFAEVAVFQCGDFRILETDGVLHTVAYTMEQGSVDTSQLPMGYIRVMLCAAVGCGGLTSNLQRGREEVACLGIGGGSLPAFLCAAFPNTHVWAVDIDPCGHLLCPGMDGASICTLSEAVQAAGQ
eukprot:jgi/Botrbrau1/14917/Bobra.0018s0021.1